MQRKRNMRMASANVAGSMRMASGHEAGSMRMASANEAGGGEQKGRRDFVMMRWLTRISVEMEIDQLYATL